MKEFALKHPFLTFLLVDAIAANICKVIVILSGHGNDIQTSVEETDETEEPDDSADSVDLGNGVKVKITATKGDEEE